MDRCPLPRVRQFAGRVVRRYCKAGLLLKPGDVLNVFEDDYVPDAYLFGGHRIPKKAIAKMRKMPEGLKPMEEKNGNGNA